MQHEIVTRAMTVWAQYDEMYDYFLPLSTIEWPIGTRGDYLESYRIRILGAVEDYTVSRRQKMLFDFWDEILQGLENVPASETTRVSIPPATMVKLNAIGNLRQLPRLWWHLYSLAYVASKLGHPNPLYELDLLVEEFYIP